MPDVTEFWTFRTGISPNGFRHVGTGWPFINQKMAKKKKIVKIFLQYLIIVADIFILHTFCALNYFFNLFFWGRGIEKVLN